MKRLLNTIPLLFLMLVAFVGPAAAQSSWLPSYNAAQKVYIAPGVDASFEGTYATQAFRTDIERAARVHNLDVYVIITASGNDAGSDARQAGPVLVRNLWTRWTADVAFNSDRALIVLMTGDGRTLTSVGVRAGGYLNGLGIMRATMNDANGPVIPVLRTYLASDPASVPVRIVNNINAIVTSKVTPPANPGSGNQPITGTNEGDNSMGIGTILLVVGGLLVACIAFIVATRPRPSTGPTSYNTSRGPAARTTSLRKPGTGFEGRLSDSRRNRTGGAAAGADVDDDNLRRHDNDGINTATAVGVGVAAGVLLSEANRRNDDEPRRDSGSSDSGYVAPVVSAPSCSTPSSDSGSTSSGSSCSSGGSSCGGGGGGGGCGGGAG